MIPALLTAVLLTGCRNPCQQLCAEIRDYAATECNLTFPDAQFSQCLADHKGGALEKGDKGVCRDNAGLVSEEWTCDDIEDYFDSAGGGDPQESDS